MKIREIINQFTETLDTKADVNWSTNGQYLQGTFIRDNHEYLITAKSINLSKLIDSRFINCIEISFQILDKYGEYSYDAGRSSKNMFSILAIVYNAIIQKITNLSTYDAIIFTATAYDGAFLQRSSLYNRLSSTLAKKHNLNSYSIRSTQELLQFYIITKHYISDILIGKLQNIIHDY